MPRHPPKPTQCPCCGQQVTFTLAVIKLRCAEFRQVYAQQWHLESIDAPEFTVIVPAFMICPSCGTPAAAPASLVQTYRRKASLPED